MDVRTTSTESPSTDARHFADLHVRPPAGLAPCIFAPLHVRPSTRSAPCAIHKLPLPGYTVTGRCRSSLPQLIGNFRKKYKNKLVKNNNKKLDKNIVYSYRIGLATHMNILYKNIYVLKYFLQYLILQMITQLGSIYL